MCTQTVNITLQKSNTFLIKFQFSRLLHREQPCHPVTTASPAITTMADELLICVSQPTLFDRRDTNYLKDNGKALPISWTCWSVFSDEASNRRTINLKCVRNPLCFRYFVYCVSVPKNCVTASVKSEHFRTFRILTFTIFISFIQGLR